ncbi:MAG: serine hydrolase domain-containing protein [Solirubrobacterales bacterium]
MPADAEIRGSCDDRFRAVREAFAENFAERGELGASLSVWVEARPVVELRGGWADSGRSRPWGEDTLVDVFSVGKAMAAICVLMLSEEGRIDLDGPVSSLWPEFARAGKEGVTPRMILAHRAGVPGIRRPLGETAMYEWGTMTRALEEEEPWWEPGTAHGYHVNTFGFLVGELVKRAAGTTLGELFRERVAEPLAADLHFGVPPGSEERVAEFLFDLDPPTERDPLPDGIAPSGAMDPEMFRSVYFNPPGISGMGTVNTPEWRAALMPSTNAHATARGIARVCAALAGGGSLEGVRILDAATIAEAATEASGGPDFVLGRPSRFGLGFQLTQPERPLGPGEHGFGHFGAGGSLGFADPDHGLAFGYAMNAAGPRWQNPRNRALIDAVYRSL